MNHTYRLVWNEAAQCLVPAPENARGRGKRSSSVKPLAAAILAAFTLDAHALPTGGAVSAGSGSIAQNGSAMTVSQTSQNLAVNWQSFNIGAAERVSFVQPNASAIALNRVLGSDPSRILGQLNANGQVWILNPNGLLFGTSAQVNVGGLVASTLNISDADFFAGKRTFSGSGGAVTNQGAINADYVALLGGQVSNEGVITAQLGTVALAAGNQITLDFNGDKLLNVQVEQGALDALAQNKQLIRADGGTVLMTAQAADALSTAVVNNTGVIEARSIENHNGVIKLLGDMRSGTVNVGGTLDASAPSPSASLLPLPLAGEGPGRGGFIETSAAHVKVADNTQVTTAAFNGLAGTWLIDPIDFTIASGSGALTTSGIGASTLSTNLGGGGNIAIATNATTAGNGDIFINSAVSWSANKLTLTAHRNIAINASLNGSGTASLALEYGQASAGGGGSDYTLSNGAQINLPAGGNFSTKLGTGGGTVAYTVITSLGAAASSNDGTLQGMVGTLGGNYALGANIDATPTSQGAWYAAGGFTPVGNSTTKFTGSFDGLGHTITGLTINRPANVAANNYQGLFGYADVGSTLRNVGLLNSSISGLSVVGTLAGRSDGAVSSTYADGGSVTGALNVIGGLIGQVGGAGSVANSYASVSVTGTSSGGSSSGVGGLIGTTTTNTVNISNCYATGAVNGATYMGGLVGQNRANIDKSYASGAVAAGGGLRGGFIGDFLAGTITNSYWDSVSTGRGSIGGTSGGLGGTVTSLTDIAAAPKAQASYTGFDFTATPVWRIYEGQTRPLLKSFLTPLTVTANSASTTYNGVAYGGGVSYSTVPNSNLLGSASVTGGGINVGSYTLTPSGLYSNQKGYDISYANGALTVNKANLTLSGSRAYDGSTIVAGSMLTATGVHGETFAVGGAGNASNLTSRNVQAGSVLASVTGLTLGASGNGGLSSNYNALVTTGSSVSITAKAVTLTAPSVSKTYDGGTAYTTAAGDLTALSALLVGGDTVTAATLAYADKNAGAGNKTVNLSAATVSDGNNGANYSVTLAGNTTSTITAKAVTLTAPSVSKIYDGGTAYTAAAGDLAALTAPLVAGDTVTAATIAYANKNAGAGNKTANLSAATINDGNNGANYNVTLAGNSTGTITAKAVTLTAPSVSKAYDGGTAYTAAAGDLAALGAPLAGGDTVTAANIAYTNKNAGSNKTVGLSAATISDGNNGANYSVTLAGNSASTITAAPLTVTANAASKTYDAQAWSGGNGVKYSGFVNGETSAVLGGALAYGGTSQGAVNADSYAITPSGLTSGNYAIAFNAGTLTINPRVPVVTGAPVDGYVGAIANVVGGATTVPVGAVVAGVGGYVGAATPLLSVDLGGNAAGTVVADAGMSGTVVANASVASAGAADVGAANANVASASAAAAGGVTGGSAQGGGADASSDKDAATAESFATEYDLVTHGCGQRLPSGLSCR